MTEHTPTPWFKGRKFEVGPRPSTDNQSDGMLCPVADVYGDNREADAAFIVEAVNNYAALRGALATIHNSTEPDALKHRDYEHLASNVYAVAKDALDGKFVDDMHAAEVYDKLYPRSAVGSPSETNR